MGRAAVGTMCVNEHLLSRLHPPALAKYLHGMTIIGEGLALDLALVFASGGTAHAEAAADGEIPEAAAADAAEAAEAALAAGIEDALFDISMWVTISEKSNDGQGKTERK